MRAGRLGAVSGSRREWESGQPPARRPGGGPELRPRALRLQDTPRFLDMICPIRSSQ